MKEKFIHLTKRFISHELIKGSSIVFAGSMVGNVLAFVFNLFVVRKLSYVSYGEYAALLSIFNLATIPAQSITSVIVRFASSYLAKKEDGKASGLYQHMFLFLCIISLCFLGIFIFFNTAIQNFLFIKDTRYIFLIGISVAVTYITVVNIAFLQSLLKFTFYTLTLLLNNVLKLGLGVVLILAGFELGGVLLAMVIATFVALLVSFYPLQHYLFGKHKDKTIEVKEIVIYARPAIISLFALSCFTSTDVLLVKHFFPSNIAGLYAGMALVGRVIFYFTAPITSVMFPMVVRRYEQKHNFQNLLYISLLLVLIPSVAITSFYFLFPNLAILIFLGGKGYITVASYIGWYGIFLTFFSLLNVLVNFFLSIKQTNVVYLLVLGALFQAILITLFHSSFTSIITISVFVTLGLLLLLLLYYYRFYATAKKNL